ncbi:hypothetical protein evm_007786 [Chilo suppressalis]|nr:hypothetical protein evm_007786 [Chilo suppressalis]
MKSGTMRGAGGRHIIVKITNADRPHLSRSPFSASLTPCTPQARFQLRDELQIVPDLDSRFGSGVHGCFAVFCIHTDQRKKRNQLLVNRNLHL